MLILTLKEDEKILLGDNISIMVVEVRGKSNPPWDRGAGWSFDSAGKAGGESIRHKRSTGRWVKAKPLVRHQDAGRPFPTERLPPAVSTPCTMTTTARPWYRREGAGQTDQCVDQHAVVATIMGVAYPSPLP
jgi:hypothetical protein